MHLNSQTIKNFTGNANKQTPYVKAWKYNASSHNHAGFIGVISLHNNLPYFIYTFLAFEFDTAVWQSTSHVQHTALGQLVYYDSMQKY